MTDQSVSGVFSLLVCKMGQVVIRGPTSQGCGEDTREIQFWGHCIAWLNMDRIKEGQTQVPLVSQGTRLLLCLQKQSGNEMLAAVLSLPVPLHCTDGKWRL